jgi:hypothetical protein
MRALKMHLCAILAAFLVADASVVTADEKPSDGSAYVSSLGDMMAAIQLRHSKLWYAFKAGNWPLADYELQQLDANLDQAKRFYANIVASDTIDTNKQAALIADAIKTKNLSEFDQSYAALTSACNACHEAASRSFIVIRRPALPSPYSNQIFAPLKK